MQDKIEPHNIHTFGDESEKDQSRLVRLVTVDKQPIIGAMLIFVKGRVGHKTRRSDPQIAKWFRAVLACPGTARGPRLSYHSGLGYM